MKRLLCSILLCIFAMTAQGQVYKCTDDAGNLTFSDEVCADDAELLGDLDLGSSGISGAGGGPESSLTLGDGSIMPFKSMVSIEVRTPLGYKTGQGGMYIPYEGTDRLVEFGNLVSMSVVTWGREGCGNLSHICNPLVRIKTNQMEITVRYEALRNVKIIIDDELDGAEKEMTVWFANRNRPHIRSIRF